MFTHGDRCSAGAASSQLAAEFNVLSGAQTLFEFLYRQTPPAESRLHDAIQRHGAPNLGLLRRHTPVLAKHSKSFSLIDCISVGVDRMQRNFEPMRKQLETGRQVNWRT